MKLLLSSSKKQNFDLDISKFNLPAQNGDGFLFEKTTAKNLKTWQKKRKKKIQKEMKVSDALAQKTFDDLQNISIANKQESLLTYTGEVYRAFQENFQAYSKKDFDFAQESIFILSGLFGLLKPLDKIPPYRLEMKFTYKDWQKEITKYLLELNEPIINLASKESIQCLDLKQLQNNFFNITFKEKKGGEYKIVAVFAKKARGIMANWIVQNKITKVDQIKTFTESKYKFNKELSSEHEFIFTRK